MNIKHSIFITAGITLIFFGNISIAADTHLTEAIKHTELALQSTEVKSIAQHMEEAKTHSEAAQSEQAVDSHLNEGIKKLDEAVKESQLGAAELAKKAAQEALAHLKQASTGK